jgi:hypothetical protein
VKTSNFGSKYSGTFLALVEVIVMDLWGIEGDLERRK